MPTFEGHKYINLETFRKNGEGVKTPLWFAEGGGILYARTFEKTGKAKRLRRESRARVAPCDARGRAKGEWVGAEAWIAASESEAAKRADALLNEKYGLLKRIIEPVAALRHGRVVVVAIRAHGSFHND
jgi:PPOX class probable F420-dependent enzyme